LISTIEGTASRAWPKNSRHTVRMCLRHAVQHPAREVMRPSQPSFCTPGRPPRNLSVTSLPRPALRKRAPGISSVSCAVRRASPSAPSWRGEPAQLEARLRDVVDLAEVVAERGRPRASCPRGRPCATRRGCRAPCPTARPSCRRRSSRRCRRCTRRRRGRVDREHQPARSAASITRLVTTPASQNIVGTGASRPGSDVARPRRALELLGVDHRRAAASAGSRRRCSRCRRRAG
jgi:hypothetical protein